jgi:hypothetical protein
MKRIDNYLILLIAVGDMGEKRRKRYGDFGLRENQRKFWAAANFGDLQNASFCVRFPCPWFVSFMAAQSIACPSFQECYS